MVSKNNVNLTCNQHTTHMKALLLVLGFCLFSITSNAQCSPFVTATMNPFLGGAVLFDNQSQADASAVYILETGDGSVYTLTGMPSSITHTYVLPGAYQYCITIYDSVTPCYATFCDSIYVNAGGVSCDAYFSAVGQGAIYDYYFDIAGNMTNVTVDHFWDFGDGNTSTSASPTHTYAAIGGYEVCHTVTDVNAACSDTYCDSVYVSANPAPGPCQSSFYWWEDSTTNQTVILINNSSGSGTISYFWDFGDGTTSNLAYPSHQYNSIGAYNVCLTITAGDPFFGYCTSTYCDLVYITFKSVGFTINVYPPAVVSLSENESISFSIYPNPATDQLTIETGELEGNSELFVRDIQGKLVAVHHVNSNSTTLDVSTLQSGVYFIQLDGNPVQRFVKE